MNLRPDQVRLTVEFPDGTKHGGIYTIDNLPDIDRLAARVKVTVAHKHRLNLGLAVVTE
ncbi:MAG: hypothetical protein K0S65_3642 [Labilithrix sp.]|nr:hypothetical protein [Labilithrix sp.]